MKRIVSLVLFAAFIPACLSAAPVPAPTIQTIPIGGKLAGQPGSALGWGFTLTYNAPSDWIVLNDSFFTGGQVYGTYNDYIVNQFIVAGPAPETASLDIPFSRGSTGLGEFDINRTGLIGASITGNIVVDYDVFSQDPNSPDFDPNSFVTAGQASIPVAINITPEPATFGLIVVAALLGLWCYRRANPCAIPAGN